MTQEEELREEKHREVLDLEKVELDFSIKPHPKMYLSRPKANRGEEEINVRRVMEQKVAIDYL